MSRVTSALLVITCTGKPNSATAFSARPVSPAVSSSGMYGSFIAPVPIVPLTRLRLSSARSNSIATDWYHLGRAYTLDELGRILDGLSCDSINRYLVEHPPSGFIIATLGAKPLEIPLGISPANA